MKSSVILALTACAPLIAQIPSISPNGADWGLSPASVWLTGRAYSQTFSYSGGTQCGPMLGDASGLPPRFTWTASGTSGTLSGTFPSPGKFVFNVSVTCGSGVARGSYTITVAGAMTMLPSGFLPPCNVGSGCLIRLTDAGVPPFTARITSGSIPAGCELVASPIGDSSWGVLLPCMATLPGTYSFDLTATDGMKETASRSYVLLVGPAAPFYTSASNMVFKVLANGPSQTQPLSAGTNDLTTVKFSASSDAAWLSATSDGAGTSSMTVTVNPAQLSPGTYTGQIKVQPEGGRPLVTVNVTAVVVAASPMLEVAPDSVTLDVAPGVDAARAYSIAFQAWNSGTLPLTADVSVTNPPNAPAWLSVQPSQLSLVPGQVSTLNVAIDAARLQPGTYQGYVQVRTGTQSKVTPVTVVVPPVQHVPILRVDRTAWRATAEPYHSDQTYRYDNSIVNVSNDDWNTSMDFTATLEGLNNAAVIEPASGRVTGSSWAELNFRFDHRRLTSGKYFGMLTITAPGARNSPRHLRVEYEVTRDQILGSATPVEVESSTPVLVAGDDKQPLTSVLKITNSSNVPIRYTLLSPSAAVTIAQPNGVAAAAAVTTASYTVNPSQASSRTDWARLEAHMWSLVANTTSIHWEPMTIIRTNPVKTSVRDAATTAACTPSKLVVLPSSPLTFFRKTIDWPVEIQAVVYDDCGNPLASAAVSAAFSNGDPAKLLALTDAAKGWYRATWIPGSPGETMSITLRASEPALGSATYQMFGTVADDPNAPIVFTGGVVNNANPVLGAPLAPGSVVAIFGRNLAASIAQAPSAPLPRQLGGTTVLIGGIEAPLFFVSPGQINAQVPFELTADSSYDVVVHSGDRYTTPKPLRSAKLTPGILAYADGMVIAQHSDYSLVNSAVPAKPGEYIILYLVGMGPVNSTVATGAASPADPLASVVVKPSVTIGGVAAEVYFAGLTPGGVGLYQVVARIPESAGAGDQTIVLTQESSAANVVRVPVGR